MGTSEKKLVKQVHTQVLSISGFQNYLLVCCEWSNGDVKKKCGGRIEVKLITD